MSFAERELEAKIFAEGLQYLIEDVSAFLRRVAARLGF